MNLKNQMNNLYIASDHAGYNLKNGLIGHFSDIIDLGTNSLESVDYPDYGLSLAMSLKDKPDAKGIAICGSGIGMSIMVNRFKWIRGALINNIKSAELSRQHGDCNVIVFGEKIIDFELACECMDIFLKTEFEGGRHIQRINKL